MIESMVIRDTISGRELVVIQETPWSPFILYATDGMPELVRKVSVRKRIRTWMREKRKQE